MLGQIINMTIITFLQLYVPKVQINQDTICHSFYSNSYYVHLIQMQQTVADLLDTVGLQQHYCILSAEPCDSKAEDLSDLKNRNYIDYVPSLSENLPPLPKKQRNKNRLVNVSSKSLPSCKFQTEKVGQEGYSNFYCA